VEAPGSNPQCYSGTCLSKGFLRVGSVCVAYRRHTQQRCVTCADSFHVDVREVDRDTLEPILFLLQSPDIEVQRAASAALGNLAVNCELNHIDYNRRTVADVA
jgi:hypothetical protein